MISCRKCGEIDVAFDKNDRSLCKSCKATYQREHYKNARMPIKEWLFEYLCSHPCVDCGEVNVLTLEFDHVNSKSKLFSIARAFIGSAKTLTDVQNEVAKCVVRCSNCHTKKTAEEQQSWKYQMLMKKLGK
jgi:5-methylcytosine-specific restriction endonuclease McrA